MSKSKYWYYLLIVCIFIVTGCSSAKQGGRPKKADRRVVPIAIVIKHRDDFDLNYINMDYYRLKVLDGLKNFQAVNLDLVEPEENPEIVLTLNIDNFVLWPRDERVSRRIFSRAVQVGTDQAGKPVYQTVNARVDIVQVQRRSSARFITEIKFKAEPPKTFQRNFNASYNYVNTYVDNIQGDSRAVNPSLMMGRGLSIEPREDDFLLALSGQEMISRLSNEIRAYYK